MSLPLDTALASRFTFVAFDVTSPVKGQIRPEANLIPVGTHLQVTQPVRTLATMALVALGRLESANMEVPQRSGSFELALGEKKSIPIDLCA